LKINKETSGRGFKLKPKIIKEIIQLREAKLSMNKIETLTKASKGSINNILKKAVQAAVSQETICAMPNDQLMNLFYPVTPKERKDEPSFEKLKDELAKPCVKAQLLWEEYQLEHPDGMSRSTFFTRLKSAGPPELPKPSMHQTPKGGEKILIDYSGVKMKYYDNGKEIEVEIFVANWMASSYMYVEASPSQKQEDWVASHVRMFRYFGCSPTYLVPDNLKGGVIKADFFDPTINALYLEMARHYDTVVLPTRSRKPQDKAGVESNVKFVQTHIIAALRDQRFTSLEELNEAILVRLAVINEKKMQRYHLSRCERFESLDRPHVKDLPQNDYNITAIVPNVMVEDDHHVRYDRRFYSAPWRLTGSRIDLWMVNRELQIYYDGERVASHPITDLDRGAYITNDLHRPPNHLFVHNLRPLWVLSEAEKIGPRTHQLIRDMIENDSRHCEFAIRKGLGLIELIRDYPPERVESAVAWSIDHAMVRRDDVIRVLEQGLDLVATPIKPAPQAFSLQHQNIRGSGHYQSRPNNYN
tara:strand:- start:1093 stop:2679 length:1587 start_codon:yes stop_codon:yes gene_type:complete